MKILLIHRNNIGDLICATPFIEILRIRYPEAIIDALVNSYNHEVLQNNPNLNYIYIYTKGKHRSKGESLFCVYWNRLRTIFLLRKKSYDYALILTSDPSGRALSLANRIAPNKIICLSDTATVKNNVTTLETPLNCHAVETLYPIATALDVNVTHCNLQIFPDAKLVEHYLATCYQALRGFNGLTIAVHISSRKKSQRWPTEMFIELISRLCQSEDAKILLLWSPGDAQSAGHPGDDAKARDILNATKHLNVLPAPTLSLTELFATVSLADLMICSDGGAMHVAAALKKPIICFFGDSNPRTWGPWMVPNIVLQKESKEVKDILVDEVLASFHQLKTTAMLS
ncbi:glycosyltransferase family 9 protein [Leeia sp. TBRC 13508]|uniref:Glycosyltransferase family 9 protein n=1 Tax=Leeia speluncae TaxID=2884804 RepID=A0ABS8D6W1_9NEIS|nr:glycosyltransferase family 9 protein [Leeia speluncae]MCB6183378.1 glycosyltransferase family 9 protein [Leeia speluncae]